MKKYIILILVLLFTLANASAEEIVIIVNKNVSVTKIDASQANSIYTLVERRWSDGSDISVFTLKSGDVNDKFYAFMNKSIAQMKKIWLKKKLNGGLKVPESVGSEDEILKKVANTPGAIGFIRKSKVNDSVKVVGSIG